MLRFFLETAGLVALAAWGYSITPGPARYLLVVLLPLVAAFAWGGLAVRNDPTRKPGGRMIVIPGPARLLLELVFFSLAVTGLFLANYPTPAWILAALVIFHYAVSYDRVAWLIANRPPTSPARTHRKKQR
jgi:drug/metabolite transporter (DMT)-like permease